MLRGAMVEHALQKEPRVEAKHFRKFLPTNDTLARAVGLEKTVKGARLLIEPTLAARLLAGQSESNILNRLIHQQLIDEAEKLIGSMDTARLARSVAAKEQLAGMSGDFVAEPAPTTYSPRVVEKSPPNQIVLVPWFVPERRC